MLAFTYFNITGASFKENVAVYDALLWKGIKEGLKIVLMVFGAFVILNLLRDTGAINEVKGAIARISDDRRVQVVIVGMMLPIFLGAMTLKTGLKQYGQICSKTVGHVLPVPPWVTLSAPITPWPPAPPWTRSVTKIRS